MSDLMNGVMLGAAGAGAGYYAATKKTAAMAEEAANLTEQSRLLKEPIIDTFKQYGYTEGMDIGKAVQAKVNKNYAEMASRNMSYEQANSAKALGKVWQREFDYLKKLETTFKTKMKEFEYLDKPAQELLEKVKTTKGKYTVIGLGVGVGLVVLNAIRKAVFGGNK